MNSVPGTKVCTKCKVEMRPEEFYAKGSGRMTRCKACHNADTLARYHAGGAAEKKKRAEAGRRHYAAERERKRAVRKRWRDANREKVREQGRRRSQAPEERARRAAYRAANRDRRVAYNAEYRERNKGLVDASHAEYRAKNREALKERQRRWREQNPERYYLIHASWKQRNPDKVKAAAHRRRLRELAGGAYTPAEWQAVKARHGNRCVMCGRHESETPLCVDHVVPLSRGGRNTADNLQPLCRSCNSKKHARLWDYRYRKGGDAWPKRNSLKPRSTSSFQRWSTTGRRAR